MSATQTSADPWPGEEHDGLSDLVGGVRGLVTPPHVFVKVTELMRSNSSSARDFEAVIALDPNLSARLLRIANSSFYNLRSKLDTISRAVAVVGMRELYTLVTAVSAVKTFAKITTDLVSMDTFWRHSVMTALIARILAKRCNALHGERLFVAGLLHDIGSLVVFNRLPEASRDLLLVAGGDEDLLYRAELETLGFSHAHVAAQLLEMWQIPATLTRAIGAHHEPSAGDADLDVILIHAADTLAGCSGLGALAEGGGTGREVPDEGWPVLGIEAGSAEGEVIIAEAQEQFVDTVSSLGLAP